jgi:hypothetical protein
MRSVQGNALINNFTLKGQRFKKITKPDTLTSSSLGHVWYSKIDGAVEFYTADGFHPVHTERRLKPMTVLIMNKYARGNAVLRAGIISSGRVLHCLAVSVKTKIFLAIALFHRC